MIYKEMKGDADLADSTGLLNVNVTSGTGSYPMVGADVIISRETETGNSILFRFKTDQSGQIPDVTLDTEDVSNSLSPSPDGAPYSLYTVTVSKNGYYSRVSLNIRIFPGIKTVQPINMIPYTATSDIGSDEYVPRNPPYDNGGNDL